MSTKPSIAIIGAGHAGLVLALGLLDKGHQVTLVSDRTPAQIAMGRITSTQLLYPGARAIERELGLDFWDGLVPAADDLEVTVVGPDGDAAFSWRTPYLPGPAASVDYRVRIPYWMSIFRRRGGKLYHVSAGLEEVESLAASHDLVIMSTGKGEIGKLFEKDKARCTYDTPQRYIAAVYVDGLKVGDRLATEITPIPGVGELFFFPVLTITGPASLLMFEGRIGGALDCWDGIDAPADYLNQAKTIVDKFAPWASDRVADVTLTDDNAVLRGCYPPTVRKPVATLPSGRKVLGMADLVVLNDPITGEGANNAVKCAKIYLDAIDAHGDQPFDESWMQQTFDTYWEDVQWATAYTNITLEGPQHVRDLVRAASVSPEIAQWHADSRSTPKDFFPMWNDPAQAEAFIARHTAAVAAVR
ncbi:FAD-binding oxidoreductase [Pseudonocardia sp. RS11V-5]|uniref:styrene monooxygenase/indole monooxygenase family protein n=1 Tax=Pseudonocardia terrae TaxID=2905831 RepID=UPI001E49247C|nr:styrene monooxygenase/indole monooxygenase family protein [Pseudonocardia terrae]MCE3555804.1 FAD-binding oxidoreductase [Pseudonocardia terrae]